MQDIDYPDMGHLAVVLSPMPSRTNAIPARVEQGHQPPKSARNMDIGHTYPNLTLRSLTYPILN